MVLTRSQQITIFLGILMVLTLLVAIFHTQVQHLIMTLPMPIECHTHGG